MIKVCGSSALFESFPQASFQEVMQFLQQPMYTIDTETTSLDPKEARLLHVQVGNDKLQYVVLMPNLDNAQRHALLEALASSNSLKIGHNLNYDYQVFLHHGCRISNLFDTMLAALVLDTGSIIHGKYTLAAQVYAKFQHRLNKSQREHFIRGEYESESAITYAAEDIEWTHKLAQHMFKELKKAKLLTTSKLENDALPAFAECEYNGLTLDTERWTKRYKDNLEEFRRTELKLDHYVYSQIGYNTVVSKGYQLDFFSDYVLKSGINFSSPAQVLKLLRCHDATIQDTKSQTLEDLAPTIPLAQKILDYRELDKLTSTYGIDFLKHIQKDGKIHYSVWQVLNTGRISISKPNLQQIPKSNEYRNCFIAEEGYQIVGADFASQELCVIATGSQDPVWLDALRTGKDLHSVCADIVFGPKWRNAAEKNCDYFKMVRQSNGELAPQQQKCECPKHKKLRNDVKAINFGLAYGMSAMKFAQRTKISQEEAEEIISTYFKAFPNIKQYLDRLGRYGLKYGEIRTFAPFYRRRLFPQWSPGRLPQSLIGQIERRSKNLPIQGTSADMVKLAMVKCYQKIKQMGWFEEVKFLLQIHDELIFMVRNEYVAQWKTIQKQLMEQAAQEILKNDLLKVEVTVAPYWKK